jgi:hypothetical protein
MHSVKSSVKEWKTAGAHLAVLIVIIQVLGLKVGWSQEPVQPQINEEFLEQEKIYHSRRTDGRRVYTTDRGLSRYAERLPSGFCDALGRLGSSDRWLDIGAGEGQAILDYYAPEDTAAPAEKCVRSGPRARAVAISIEDRRKDNWKQHADRLGDDHNTLSLRQAPAAIFARGAWKIPDHYRRVRRLHLYRGLIPVR